MKKSEVRQIVAEQIKNLFEIKYTQNDNLRIWLSPDKTTIYLDNVSDSRTPWPIWPIVKAFTKEFSNLMVVDGDTKWIKDGDLLVMQKLDDKKIDEKKLEKLFYKIAGKGK